MQLFSCKFPFWKANFHCHSTASDGKLSPDAVVDFYASCGYDVLSITDHRKVTQVSSSKLLLIPGIEIDYQLPGQWVHVVGLGMRPEITQMWRREGTPQEGIDLIHDLEGLAILAHPAWSLNTPTFIQSLQGIEGVEIWNSVSTLPLNGDRADSSSILDVTWASGGSLIPVFANDDAHQYQADAGVAATMVQAEECTREAIMEALRAGRFYATTGPEIQQIEINGQEITVDCSPAEAVIFYSDCPWASGRVVMGNGITKARYTIRESDHFVRVEVRDAKGRKAWSSPISTRP